MRTRSFRPLAVFALALVALMLLPKSVRAEDVAAVASRVADGLLGAGFHVYQQWPLGEPPVWAFRSVSDTQAIWWRTKFVH